MRSADYPAPFWPISGIAVEWTTGILLLAGPQMFLSAASSALNLEPIQPLIKWVPRAMAHKVMWPEREADQLPSNSWVWNAYDFNVLKSVA
jgi:hypothetical protein